MIVLRLPTLAAVLAVPFTLALIGTFVALVSWGLAALVLTPANRVAGLALSALFWLALIAFITWVLQRLFLAAFMFCMWWMERPSERGGP